MTKTVSAYEARTKLGELMNLVYYKGIEVIVKRMGKPIVKISRIEDFGEKDLGSKERVLRFAGIWDNEDGRIIEKHAKKLKKKGEFIPS